MGTYAPQRLLELRRYLKPLTGLPDNALGIVGDATHEGGYHHGWNLRRMRNGATADYSWTESLRDRNHPSDAASAFDIGTFARLRELSLWLVSECEAGAADTLDIREIIYSPDGKTVKRWDRLGHRTSGDPSHLTHTHVSYFRDAEPRDKIHLYQRFFERVAMSDADRLLPNPGIPGDWTQAPAWEYWRWADKYAHDAAHDAAQGLTKLEGIEDKLDALQPGSPVDPAALAQALVAQPDFYPRLGAVIVAKLLDVVRGGMANADQA